MNKLTNELAYLIRGALQKLVEGVEVVVSGLLRDHSGFLQQVVVDVAAHRVTLVSKLYQNVTMFQFS
jgi:hypothetical protein